MFSHWLNIQKHKSTDLEESDGSDTEQITAEDEEVTENRYLTRGPSSRQETEERKRRDTERECVRLRKSLAETATREKEWKSKAESVKNRELLEDYGSSKGIGKNKRKRKKKMPPNSRITASKGGKKQNKAKKGRLRSGIIKVSLPVQGSETESGSDDYVEDAEATHGKSDEESSEGGNEEGEEDKLEEIIGKLYCIPDVYLPICTECVLFSSNNRT